MLRVRRAPDYVIYGDGITPYGPRPPSRLSDDAHAFWDCYGLGEATDGVAVYDKSGLAGFFRFSMDAEWLCLAGTWVRPDVRGQGIGLRMWQWVIRRHKPTGVYGVAASVGGWALIQSAQRLWPDLNWDIAVTHVQHQSVPA